MRRAIVTGGTKNDTAPIAVFAINIKATNEKLFDELIVFHDGIKEKDQKLIKQIFPTRFIEYKYPGKSKNDEVVSYFSSMVFCKYECFKLLNEYDIVVWSDYDVVIQGDLSCFCELKDDSFRILTCETSVKDMFYKNIEHDEINKYDLDLRAVGTPLFALSNHLHENMKIYDWCYRKTIEWDSDLYLPEQCIFSLAVQEFDITVERFPFDIYACYPTKVKGDEIIIHAAGQPKFWNGLNNETWNAMYSEWISMGGSRYRDSIKRIKRKMIFIITRLLGMRAKEHY